jgi:hypothetical protein
MPVQCQVELHDYEIIKVENVLRTLNSFKSSMTWEQFERNAIDEFGAIGLKVVVLWEVGGLEAMPTEMVEATLKLMLRPGIPTPEISIVDRLEKVDFDHERQTWEVQRDILGIDQPGAIGKNGLITPPKSTAFITKKD